MAVTIRAEHPDDYAGIEDVNRLAFGQDGEARLVAALRQADGFDPGFSLVAVRDRKAVGHILFSPIRIETDSRDLPALALAPMAVLPEHQRRGIGSDLVRDGLEACRRAGHAIVVVLGHAEFYSRFGFTPASRFGIRCAFSVPDEAFMALALAPGSLDGVSGVVRYPAPFEDV